MFYDESISHDLLTLRETFGKCRTPQRPFRLERLRQRQSVDAITSVQLKPARSALGLFIKIQSLPHIPIA